MGSEQGGPIHALSVDVEEWFNATILQETGRVTPPEEVVVRNCRTLMELFAATRSRATWFFLGEVAERYPFLVAEAVAAGHELGVHGFHHHQPAALGRSRFREALRRAKDVVETAGGKKATGYRAVDFGVNESSRWVLDEVLDAGFEYDSSIFPARMSRYGVANACTAPHWQRAPSGRWIFEVPVSVLRLGGLSLPFAGGGYFRLLPLALTRLAAWWVARRRPLVFYLHPCEVEKQSEMGRCPAELSTAERERILSRFAAQHSGRSRGSKKYRKLLSSYPFRPIGEVVDLSRLSVPTTAPEGVQEVAWRADRA